MRLLIIGGSDGGISAGLRARELDPSVEVTMVVADAYPNFSICGLPYYISGDVPDWHDLAHRTREEIDATGIRLRLDTRATHIDPQTKSVAAVSAAGVAEVLAYDRLVIATGAVPIRPPIAGLDLDGVHVLHTMEDSFAVHRRVSDGSPRSAVIVGAGYIGLEMAEALTTRGLEVTVVEQLPEVLPTVDPELGSLVRRELQAHGVTVLSGTKVEAIERSAARLRVSARPDLALEADLVLVVVGVRPDTELARGAGVQLGVRAAIGVTRRMETNVPDIYAAGDCVETWHRVLQRNAYLPLGTTAHKQGRVAGENAIGGEREFAGSLGTQVVKVFDIAIARTGLRDHEAAGFEPVTVGSAHYDHKAYYPGAQKIEMRWTGDRRTGRLLGAQFLGDLRTEVAKRIDIVAAALFHGMTVEATNDLDLSYTPPLGSPWDTVQLGAQTWVRAVATAHVGSDGRSIT